MKLLQKKLLAFTLAETLITMGIIGVIAALTIPSLTNSTNSKDTIAKVKKAHTVLSDAYGRMISDSGEIADWSDNLTSNAVGYRMFKSMSVSKNCGITTNGACFTNGVPFYKATSSSAISNTANVNADAEVYKVISADAMSYGIGVSNNTCALNVITSGNTQGSADLSKVCGTIIVDIDGPGKGKGRHGIDVFEFYLTEKGIYPVGLDVDGAFNYTSQCIKVANKKTAQMPACTAWVSINNNLDYKDVGTDGKCPNNTAKVLDFTANTKCDN